MEKRHFNRETHELPEREIELKKRGPWASRFPFRFQASDIRNFNSKSLPRSRDASEIHSSVVCA